MPFNSSRRAATATALLGLLVSGLTVLTNAAGSTPARAASAAGDATGVPGKPFSFGEGDVIATEPSSLVSAVRSSTKWRTVAVPDAVAPSAALGAVLVSVSARGATRAGQVQMRPAGSATTGNVALSYRSGTDGGVATSVVPVSAKGIQWRSTAGAPRVTVRALGWVPKTSALTSSDHGKTASTTASPSAKLLRLPGISTAGTTVLVQVTTNRSGAGSSRLAIWSPSATPQATTMVRSGPASYLAVLHPDAAGRVKVRSSSGKIPVTLTVVGSATDAVTLDGPPAERSLASAKPGAVRTIRLAGAAGVPASDVRVVLLKVQAPAGAAVKLWRSDTSAPPEHSFTSDGTAAVVAIRPDVDGTVKIRTTGIAATSLIASGWATGGGVDQVVSITPFTDTRLYGPADVAEQGAGFVVIRSTSAPVPVGGHVLVKPRSDAGTYVGEVTAVDTVAGGRKLTLANTDLPDAFADYRVTYGTPSTTPTLARNTTGTGSALAQSRVEAAAASAIDVEVPLGKTGWSCSTGGVSLPVQSSVSTTVDPNVDLSLADRSVDLSVKETISASITFSGGSYSCAREARFLGDEGIPIGSSGLSVNLGAKIQLSADLTEPTTLSGTERGFASYFHNPAGDSHNEAADVDFVPTGTQGSITLDLGIFVALDMGVPGLKETRFSPELEGSIEFGISYTAGPAGNDFKGPNCQDATIGPYAAIGGKLLFEFFGVEDVALVFPDIRKDFAHTPLVSGKCYGYTGTIEYTEKTHQEVGTCGTGPCKIIDQSMAITTTLHPERAKFPGGGVMFQSYTWTGSRVNSTTDLSGGCSDHAESSAAGAHGYGVDNEPGPYVFVDSGTPRAVDFFGSSLPGPTITTTVNCPGQDPLVQTFPEGYAVTARVPFPENEPRLDQAFPPSITVNETFVQGETTRTIKVDLVRGEFTQ